MDGASNDRRPRLTPNDASAVLIVEDEVLVRMVVADHLRDVGYTVIEAANADEAIEALRIRSDIGIVLTDVRMPGTMDGLGLAKHVRNEYPAIKIILSSGHLRDLDWTHLDGFLTKPYELADLVRKIKTLTK
jgi:CheY-like chemotaxis protein